MEQASNTVQQLYSAKYKYVLSTPENILNSAFNYVLKQDSYQKDDGQNVYVIVDECHWVVQWGLDFRRKYSEIHQLRCILPRSHFLWRITARQTQFQENYSILQDAELVLHRIWRNCYREIADVYQPIPCRLHRWG